MIRLLLARPVLVVVLAIGSSRMGYGQTPVANLTCVRSCGTPTTELSWTNPVAYASIEIYTDGFLIATLPGTDTSFSDSPGSDTVDYEVSGVVGISGTPVPCSIGSVTAPYPDHVVLALEGAGGLVDSVGVLEAELIARGDTYEIVTDVEQLPCLFVPGPPTTVWAMTGTFPDHAALDQDTGAWLFQHVEAGGGVYLEGSDNWTFDAPTAFTAVDGVQDFASTPGDDSLVAVVGTGYFDGMSATYTQDQPGIDGNDQLVPATTDIAGPNATVVWLDGTESFAVGVYYETDAPFGNVFSQSFEIGGYGGAIGPLIDDLITGVVGRCVRVSTFTYGVSGSVIDLAWTLDPDVITDVVLVATHPLGGETEMEWSGTDVEASMDYPYQTTGDGRYSFALSTSCPSGDGLETPLEVEIGTRHRRGDANGDGTKDIADIIEILDTLFGGGASFLCDNAADVNDDNSINIGDPVFMLTILFSSTTLSIPYPCPDCGVDPDGGLSCLIYAPCP